MTWALNELDRVMGGDVVASGPVGPGGEWDAIRGIPLRRRRCLIGALYLTPTGLRPDVAAEIIAQRVAGINSIDDAMEWYVRTALTAVGERRIASRLRRRKRLHLRHGYSSEYDYRNARSIERGYRSLWCERVARGWV